MAEGIRSKCTWAKKKSQNEQQSPPVTSFVEIMSETLAAELQEKDLQEFDDDQKAIEASLREMDDFQESNDCSRDYELAMQLSEDPDYSVDAQMALELQRQFDREAEYERQQEEVPVDVQNSKKGKTITLGTDRFEYSKLEHELNQNGEEDTDEEREKETDNFYQSKVQEFPPCGFKRDDDGNIITKHDKEIGQKRNCQKMMQRQFPIEFNSGDVLGQKISSSVYNDLQLHARKEKMRKTRLKDKQNIATSDASVDVKSRLILLNWINQGVLDRVEGVIAIGKESTVLNAICDSNEVGSSTQPSGERRFAIKVHKQVLNAFRNRSDYVKDDIRFKNPRKIMKIWANKEYLNLTRIHKANIPSPEPINFKKHIVLMSLIQDETGKPAPKLKNYIFASDEEKLEVFGQVKEIMIKMYQSCNLVHADLSEFNLLFADGKIFVIDVAQSVDLSHPQSLIFLQRDIEHVLGFFEKNATEGLPTTHALFSEITNINVDPEKDLLTQIESFNEQNLFTHLAKFRKTPGDYDLILADMELEDMELNDDSEESDKE